MNLSSKHLFGGYHHGYPGDSGGKESACNAGDTGLISESGRSLGERNGNLLQYACWEIPWTEESGGLQSMGSQRVGHGLMTNTFTMAERIHISKLSK